MKNFPALFNARKDVKDGARPVWILKLSAGGSDYYLSDSAFPVAFWGITTKAWVKTWGSLREGISGAMDEFKISDTSVTCIADPEDSPNIVDLALGYNLEQNPCSLYLWFADDEERIADSATLVNHAYKLFGSGVSPQSSTITNGVARLYLIRTVSGGGDYRLLSSPDGVEGLSFSRGASALYTFEIKIITGKFEVYVAGPVVDDQPSSQRFIGSVSYGGTVSSYFGVVVTENVVLPDGYRRVTFALPASWWTGSGTTGHIILGTPYTLAGNFQCYYRLPSFVQPGAGCGDPPQEFFRGYIRDYPITEGDTICNLEIQDETLKWERTYVGDKITLQKYPEADPDDVGKIEPIVFGALEKFPALGIDCGIQVSLTNPITATAVSMKVSDGSLVKIGMFLQVDSEEIKVTGVAGDTLTVVRGQNSTLAAAHQQGAVAWEQKTEFVYIVAGHPVDTIPKAYAVFNGFLLDISLLCTVWPSGNHPSYPGKAVISVPGYMTVDQAVSLAIADGIVVGNGTLAPALSGNVTKTGTAALAGNVGTTGNPALTGSPALSGGVTLSGLIALLGSLTDPGHTHNTGQSNSESTTTAMPTGVPAGTSGYWANGTYGIAGFPNVYYIYLDFPADGARSSTTYNITFVPLQTVANASLYAVINGTIYCRYDNNVQFTNGVAFPFSFTVNGDVRVDRVYIVTGFVDTSHMKITAATRTIMLTNLVSSASQASLNNTLSASNGTLGTANTLAPGAGTLATNKGTLAATNNTLNVAESITVDKGTLSSLLSGNVAKTGTVTLSGNSVANTLVGDKLLVNVTRSLSSPGAAIGEILSTWCGVTTLQQVGAFPASYAFNGAIVDYRLALDVVNEMAFQCRAWFRHSLGKGVLTVRSFGLAPVKMLETCRTEGGKKQYNRSKTPYGEIINSIKLLYRRDWTQDKSERAYTAVTEDLSQDSIDLYGLQERPDLFRFDLVTGDDMADDLLWFYLTYHAMRHWLHEIGTDYRDSELEFADGVTVALTNSANFGYVQEAAFNPGSDAVDLKIVE